MVRTRGSETLLSILFLSNVARATLGHSVNRRNNEKERDRERGGGGRGNLTKAKGDVICRTDAPVNDRLILNLAKL